MFITLRFGDDNKLLVNPNCATKNILDFIKEKCECEKSVTVDLCDENGCVKYLHEQPEMDLATDILETKATYIPLLLEKNDDDSIKKFVPLLESANKVYPGLKKKLKEQCPSNEPEKSSYLKTESVAIKGKTAKSIQDIGKPVRGKGVGKKRS